MRGSLSHDDLVPAGELADGVSLPRGRVDRRHDDEAAARAPARRMVRQVEPVAPSDLLERRAARGVARGRTRILGHLAAARAASQRRARRARLERSARARRGCSLARRRQPAATRERIGPGGGGRGGGRGRGRCAGGEDDDDNNANPPQTPPQRRAPRAMAPSTTQRGGGVLSAVRSGDCL